MGRRQLPADPAGNMTYLEAVALGVVQGLTEFLPVSSDGHLQLASLAMSGLHQPLAFDMALHLGTLGAVLIGFGTDVKALVLGLLPGGDPEARRLAGLVVLATIPTGVMGLAIKKSGLHHMGAEGIACGLLVTAGFDFSTRFTRGGTGRLSAAKALLIGILQGFAPLPGVSRSASTIATAMACGLSGREAARFSFLCSIPAIAGATLVASKDLFDGQEHMPPLGPVMAGVVASALVGGLALAFLKRQLEQGSFEVWGVYCVILAGAVFTLARSGGTP